MVGRRERGTFNNRDNGFTRLFINLGTKDGFYKASFLQYILDESDLKKECLGKIDLREMNAWIEIDKSVAGKMIKSIDGTKYNGRLVRMNEADGGFKRPTDEGGRKRIPMREKRYYLREPKTFAFKFKLKKKLHQFNHRYLRQYPYPSRITNKTKAAVHI